MSKKKKSIDLTPYENREALCPHFGKCGGCVYQKISYDRQLEMKASKVKGLLEGVYGDSFCFEGIISSPSEEGYRNKMEFTFGDEYKDGPFALGLHQKGSFMNIVNITDCHLIHNDMNMVRNAVRDYFNQFFEKGIIKFRNNKTHEGWLRHLLVRRAASTGEILVALVTTSDSGFEEYVEGFKNTVLGLKTEGEVVGILHIINDSLSDVVQSDRTDILYGRDYINENVLGLDFKVSVFSFFQTNTKGAELLYDKARSYAADARGMLFDLYSGTGTIAQLMARAVDEVIGVEIVEEAVSSDSVQIGQIVTIKDDEFGDEEEYRIVGSTEADPMNGKISNESPVGKAILGKKKGDKVVVEVNGNKIDYTIVDIKLPERK